MSYFIFTKILNQHARKLGLKHKEDTVETMVANIIAEQHPWMDLDCELYEFYFKYEEIFERNVEGFSDIAKMLIDSRAILDKAERKAQQHFLNEKFATLVFESMKKSGGLDRFVNAMVEAKDIQSEINTLENQKDEIESQINDLQNEKDRILSKTLE